MVSSDFNTYLLLFLIQALAGIHEVITQLKEEKQINPACYSFQVGDPEKQEFYSPNYPGLYPNNTDCIRVITADVGHLLRLDFRDTFDLEPSKECTFDYLEIRDGAHGYSTKLGTWCGKDFPPILTSTDRHLWLRFHSDENIEYNGFRAVYTMIPKPTTPLGTVQPELENCVIRASGNEGFINSSDIDPEMIRLAKEHNLQIDCMWIIEVKKGWRIQLNWDKFKLFQPNDCEANVIDVFGEKTDLPSRMCSLCGSMGEYVTSKKNILQIRFAAESKAVNSSFSALFTAFRERGAGCSEETEYDCEDGNCIDIDLLCNGRENCRYNFDEDDCKPAEKKLTDNLVIVLTIFFVILTGMCFAFLFNCFKKLVRDHHLIQAQLRESRESRLEQLGRKTPAASVMTPLATVLSNSGGTGSQSIRSVSPPRLRAIGTSTPTIPGVTPARSDCYVPTAASSDILPIVMKEKSQPSACSSSQDNGEAVFLKHGDSTSADVDDVDHFLLPDDIHFPEMRDNECQTRESLFHNPSYTPNSSASSATPPPPPPPTSRHPTRSPLASVDQQTSTFRPSADSRSTPGGSFTTFGYGRNKPSLPPEQKFRAEAVIQMDKYAPGDPRPYSVDSTKSAPDVIVTH